MIDKVSSGARDPRVIADSTIALTGDAVPDTTPYALTQLQVQLASALAQNFARKSDISQSDTLQVVRNPDTLAHT